MSVSDILDESWIQEQQRIQDIKHNYCKENMDSITVHSLFINSNKHLDKIVNSEVSLVHSDQNNKYIPKKTILQLIQQNKKCNTCSSNSEYKLIDIASFFITIEPEHIQSFSKTTPTSNTNEFFKFHPSIHDIVVPPSIFIFHKVNSIFLIYQETIQRNKNYTIKSILKTTPNKNSKRMNTKKVRIDTQLNESYNNVLIKHKKTRKNVSIST